MHFKTAIQALEWAGVPAAFCQALATAWGSQARRITYRGATADDPERPEVLPRGDPTSPLALAAIRTAAAMGVQEDVEKAHTGAWLIQRTYYDDRTYITDSPKTAVVAAASCRRASVGLGLVENDGKAVHTARSNEAIQEVHRRGHAAWQRRRGAQDLGHDRPPQVHAPYCKGGGKMDRCQTPCKKNGWDNCQSPPTTG